jgi:hypothetical protein
MRVLPRRVELSFDMSIQRPHYAYPGEQRRAAALSNKQQRFHRGLPFCGIVFGLRELGDVERSVAKGDQLLAVGQFDWIEEIWFQNRAHPGQLSGRLWLCGTWRAAPAG